MALPKVYNAGTITVALGETAVAGTGTAWLNTVKQYDVLRKNGLAVSVASVEANGALTLSEPSPWDLEDATYEIAITYDGPEFQLKTREVIAQLNELAALGIQPNAFGTGSDRDQFDSRKKGFIFLDLGDPWTLYAKASDDDADWSDGQTIEGAPGANGLIGEWKGMWSAGAFDALDAVSHEGSSYIANTPTEEAPPHADWDIVAAKGLDGWSPLLAGEADGARRVLKLTGYVGGEGDEPTDHVGEYLKADGTFTATIGDAMDIRGPAGANGEGTVASVVEGTGISVDATDPTQPIVGLSTTTQTTINSKVDMGGAIAAALIFG